MIFPFILRIKFLAVFFCLIGPATLAFSEEPAKKEGAAGGEAAKPQLKRLPGGYVHNWIGFPNFSGKSVFSEETIQVAPEKGYVSIVIFIASWCERCQRLIAPFEQLREEFKDLPVHVVYVFSHDTLADSQGFSKEHQIKGQGLLGNHDILKAFHNPPLPSIYIGDRWGWLLDRFLDVEIKDIEETRRLVRLMTAI